jgi:hypothetical protein
MHTYTRHVHMCTNMRTKPVRSWLDGVMIACHIHTRTLKATIQPLTSKPTLVRPSHVLSWHRDFLVARNVELQNRLQTALSGSIHTHDSAATEVSHQLRTHPSRFTCVCVQLLCIQGPRMTVLIHVCMCVCVCDFTHVLTQSQATDAQRPRTGTQQILKRTRTCRYACTH